MQAGVHAFRQCYSFPLKLDRHADDGGGDDDCYRQRRQREKSEIVCVVGISSEKKKECVLRYLEEFEAAGPAKGRSTSSVGHLLRQRMNSGE